MKDYIRNFWISIMLLLVLGVPHIYGGEAEGKMNNMSEGVIVPLEGASKLVLTLPDTPGSSFLEAISQQTSWRARGNGFFVSRDVEQIDIPPSEQQSIYEQLRAILGQALIPDEAEDFLKVFEGMELDPKKRKFHEVKCYHLSFRQGKMRIAVSGKLEDLKPVDYNIVIAQEKTEEKLDEGALLPENFLGMELPSFDAEESIEDRRTPLNLAVFYSTAEHEKTADRPITPADFMPSPKVIDADEETIEQISNIRAKMRKSIDLAEKGIEEGPKTAEEAIRYLLNHGNIYTIPTICTEHNDMFFFSGGRGGRVPPKDTEFRSGFAIGREETVIYSWRIRTLTPEQKAARERLERRRKENRLISSKRWLVKRLSCVQERLEEKQNRLMKLEDEREEMADWVRKMRKEGLENIIKELQETVKTTEKELEEAEEKLREFRDGEENSDNNPE